MPKKRRAAALLLALHCLLLVDNAWGVTKAKEAMQKVTLPSSLVFHKVHVPERNFSSARTCGDMLCGLQAMAAKAKARNIYKEVADKASGASPDMTGKSAIGCKKNDASCYDHTNNTGIGLIRVSHEMPLPQRSPYNYAEVLHKSFIFYYQQRSGKLPQQVHLPLPSQHSPNTACFPWPKD